MELSWFRRSPMLSSQFFAFSCRLPLTPQSLPPGLTPPWATYLVRQHGQEGKETFNVPAAPGFVTRTKKGFCWSFFPSLRFQGSR